MKVKPSFDQFVQRKLWINQLNETFPAIISTYCWANLLAFVQLSIENFCSLLKFHFPINFFDHISNIAYLFELIFCVHVYFSLFQVNDVHLHFLILHFSFLPYSSINNNKRRRVPYIKTVAYSLACIIMLFAEQAPFYSMFSYFLLLFSNKQVANAL